MDVPFAFAINNFAPRTCNRSAALAALETPFPAS
jgi:hypothetical protein